MVGFAAIKKCGGIDIARRDRRSTLTLLLSMTGGPFMKGAGTNLRLNTQEMRVCAKHEKKLVGLERPWLQERDWLPGPGRGVAKAQKLRGCCGDKGISDFDRCALKQTVGQLADLSNVIRQFIVIVGNDAFAQLIINHCDNSAVASCNH